MKRKYNPIVDFSKFTSNKNIFSEAIKFVEPLSKIMSGLPHPNNSNLIVKKIIIKWVPVSSNSLKKIKYINKSLLSNPKRFLFLFLKFYQSP